MRMVLGSRRDVDASNTSRSEASWSRRYSRPSARRCSLWVLSPCSTTSMTRAGSDRTAPSDRNRDDLSSQYLVDPVDGSVRTRLSIESAGFSIRTTGECGGSSHEKSFAGSLRLRRATTQLRSRSWSRPQPSGEPWRGRGERTSRRTSPSCASVARSASRATASFRSSRRTSEPCSSTHSSTLKGSRDSCFWTGRTFAATSAPRVLSWKSCAAPRTTSAARAPPGCALPERLRTSSPLSWATPTAGWWSGFTGGWSLLRSRG